MKWLLLLLLTACSGAFGAEIILEKGESSSLFARPMHYSYTKYHSISIRSDGYKFIEGIVGAWDGGSKGRFTGLSIGAKTKGRWFSEITAGGAYIVKPEPNQFDGRELIMLSFGIGRKFDDFSIFLKSRYFFNGKLSGQNHGFDVQTLNISTNF